MKKLAVINKINSKCMIVIIIFIIDKLLNNMDDGNYEKL